MLDRIVKFCCSILVPDEDVACEERAQELAAELAALKAQIAEQQHTQQERNHGL